jgi:outer membrane protein
MKSYRLGLCLALLAVLLFGTSSVWAQTIKVGVVNFARLLEEAPQSQASQRVLTEEFSPRERDIRSQEQQLKQIEERLSQGEGFMGEEERQQLEREARDLQREVNRSKSEFNEDLSLRRNEELGKLQRMLIGEVQGYGRDQNYDILISEAAGVVYASTAVDITDSILEVLKSRYAAQGGGN